MTMIGLTAAIKSAEYLDEAAGIIAKLVEKLKTQPDIAAQKLGQALAEVAKTLQLVEQAASEYLSLGIDEGALTRNSKVLLDIDGGILSTEVQRGRGHCHVIRLIYENYLDKWFHKALNADEYATVAAVFQTLGDADRDLFEDLEKVAMALQTESGAVIEFVIMGDEAKARARVLSAMPALRPLRKTISKTMQTIYSMQSVFVDITGAV